MKLKTLLSLLALTVFNGALHARTVNSLRDGWSLQSACKLQVGGDAITAPAFPVEGWLKLSNDAGHVVSRNFYWVPGTLTTFDWVKTDYTHTPAIRHEDLTALSGLPPAQISARAEIEDTPHGHKIVLHLENPSATLAFQVHAAVHTQSGDLIAPIFWSDNWIEIVPGEATTLTALLPESKSSVPTVQVEGWNIAAVHITPTAATAAVH